MIKKQLFSVFAGAGLACAGAFGTNAALLVDFEETGDDNNTLPTGFVSLAGTDAGLGPATFTNVAASDVGIGGVVDVVLSATAVGVPFFDRNPVTTSGDDLDGLARDFAFVGKQEADGLYITVSGIAAGTYTFTGFFHDGRSNTLDQGVVDVFVDTGSGESQALNDVAYTSGNNLVAIASGSFDFTADGINDVIFRIDNPGTSGNGAHVINGFTIEVVPEPSSLALIGLGGLCVLRRRRSN